MLYYYKFYNGGTLFIRRKSGKLLFAIIRKKGNYTFAELCGIDFLSYAVYFTYDRAFVSRPQFIMFYRKANRIERKSILAPHLAGADEVRNMQ